MRRILVIEDDEPIAAILERGLGLAGYDVVVETDGKDGQERWAVGGFAAVLLDVMLPGADGLDIAAERRAAGDATPVLLVTARDDERLLRRAQQVGVDAVLVKPFEYRVLLERVADLIARRAEPVAGAADRLDE
ncbi:MAG: response regulator transcription factor [Candidatus Limnocylindrales bacterium]